MGSIYKKINPDNKNAELVIKKCTGLILLNIQQTGFIFKILKYYAPSKILNLHKHI